MKFPIYLLFPLFFLQNTTAQTLKDLKKIEKTYQICLDTGEDMLGCTNRFYTEMDNLLNIAYQNYSATLAQAEKEQLKIEQRAWLKQRDARIKKQAQVLKRKGNHNDEIMALRNENAVFVKQRVLVLIEKMKQR